MMTMPSSFRRALGVSPVLALFAVLISSAQAEDAIRTQRVQFAKGANSAITCSVRRRAST